jgi:IclR family acetate operon transcriptional repressor
LLERHAPINAVTSLERGLQVIELLIEVEADAVCRAHGLAIQQVADELGVHTSTAARVMRSLVAQGFAVPNGGSRGYRLGPAMRIHQRLTVDERRLRELARPFLEQLVEATGECAHAAIASGSWALVIDDVETDQPLRVVAGRGRHVSLHCTSAGKCLVAFGLAPMPYELRGRTSRTITNPDMLRLHLTEVVERGYALDDEENDPGVRCISAPVFNALGQAIGCVGIDGPSVRVTKGRIDELAAHVTAAAKRLSATIAERGPVSASDPAPLAIAQKTAAETQAPSCCP